MRWVAAASSLPRVATKGIVLEMTDPAQLVASPQRDELTLEGVPAAQGGRFKSLYRAIWAPIGPSGRSDWTDEQWIAELQQPGTKAFAGRIDGADIAMAQLGWSGNGDAAFVVIGLIPAWQGQGLGGDLLTRLTQLMWQTPAPNGRPTERVWLWTIPDEHPHTVPNYFARGFVRGLDLD